jgi:hypothetical protein
MKAAMLSLEVKHEFAVAGMLVFLEFDHPFRVLVSNGGKRVGFQTRYSVSWQRKF